MAKSWNYAKLSQDAATAGGPDALIKMIKKAAYNKGVFDTKSKLVAPLLLVGIGIGTAGVFGYQKMRQWISEKKKVKVLTEHEAAFAEELLTKELILEMENNKDGGNDNEV